MVVDEILAEVQSRVDNHPDIIIKRVMEILSTPDVSNRIIPSMVTPDMLNFHFSKATLHDCLYCEVTRKYVDAKIALKRLENKKSDGEYVSDMAIDRVKSEMDGHHHNQKVIKKQVEHCVERGWGLPVNYDFIHKFKQDLRHIEYIKMPTVYDYKDFSPKGTNIVVRKKYVSGLEKYNTYKNNIESIVIKPDIETGDVNVSSGPMLYREKQEDNTYKTTKVCPNCYAILTGYACKNCDYTY